MLEMIEAFDRRPRTRHAEGKNNYVPGIFGRHLKRAEVAPCPIARAD